MLGGGSKLGLATHVVLDQFFKTLKDHGGSKRGVQPILFGAVFVMAVHASDCMKDWDVYETFIVDVTKILWKGRRAGAKDFHITVDFNVELGLLCTDDEDNEERNQMYGLVLARMGKRAGRIQKADVVWHYEGVQLQGYFYIVL